MRYSQLLLLISALVMATPFASAQAQEEVVEVDPDALREQWPQMTSPEFIKAVEDSWDVRSKWEAERLEAYRKAIYDEAARRMLAADEDLEGVREGFQRLFDWTRQSLTKDEFKQLVRDWLFVYDAANKLPAADANVLVRTSRDYLTPEELAQVQADIRDSLGDVRERSLDDIKGYMERSFYATPRKHEDLQDRRRVVSDWVAAHDMAPLTTDELVTLFGYLRPYTPDARAINVTWTGWITPPRSGEYQFDVSPITISTAFGGEVYAQDATVQIGGVEVVTATSLDWGKRRDTVTLTAGEPVAVSMKLVNSAESTLPRRGIGLLYWSGPGVSRQIVPAEFYRGPEGAEPGLLCRVDWVDNNNKWNTEEARVDAIDQVFNEASIAMPVEPFERVATLLLDRMLAPEAFEPPPQVEGEPAKPVSHPILTDQNNVRTLVNCVPSATRARFARELAQHPDVLTSSSSDGLRVFQLFEILQPGAEREAMDALGAWMKANPNIAPSPATTTQEYFDQNRYRFRQLCVPALWQHADSLKWLQDSYLEAEDGVCSLPAAYVLGYGHQMQGKRDAWVQFLDAKLEDAAIAGDTRVNWLIARAMAEEISTSSTERHYIGREVYSAGDQWLALAATSAQSDEARLRVLSERTARAIAMGDYEAAEELVQSTPGAPAELSDQISTHRDRWNERQAARRRRAQASYLGTMRDRQKKAQEQGVDIDIARYEELIGRIEAQQQAETNAN